MLYLIVFAFFFAPLLPPLPAVVEVFLVTLVEVFANEDVDFALGVVAFGLVCAGVADGVGVTAAAAGFFVESTFCRMKNGYRRGREKIDDLHLLWVEQELR